MDYKQKITTINYFEKVVKISLTREEWNSSGTWVESMTRKGCERLSKDWFDVFFYLEMLKFIHTFVKKITYTPCYI